jgi:transposase
MKKSGSSLKRWDMDFKRVPLGGLLGDKGYIRGPFGSALKRPELKKQGIPVYEQQHAINGARDFRFFIDENKFKQLKRFCVQPDDLIISCSGTLLRSPERLIHVIDSRKECEVSQEQGEQGAMKAYSMDLREKVLRAVDQGFPREEIVKLLGVSLATIKRYLKQRRETGTVAPKAIAGRPPKKLGPLQAERVAQLQAHDDRGLQEQCRLWEQSHGVRVSTSTMSRAIQRLGWTRNKRRWRKASGVRKSERAFASR